MKRPFSMKTVIKYAWPVSFSTMALMSFQYWMSSSAVSEKAMCIPLERQLAEIKQTKIELASLAAINIEFLRIDTQLDDLKRKKDEKSKAQLASLKDKFNEHKKDLDKIHAELNDKLLKADLKIAGLQGQLDYKIDPAVANAIKEEFKPKALTEERKKELTKQIEEQKIVQAKLRKDRAESQQVLENADNLQLRFDEPAAAAKTKEEAKKEELSELESAKQTVCESRQEISKLKEQINEHLKDKQEIARIASKGLDKDKPAVAGATSAGGVVPENYMMLMMQQMTMMMQGMQMMQMNQQNRFTFWPSPYLDNGSNMYGSSIPFHSNQGMLNQVMQAPYGSGNFLQQGLMGGGQNGGMVNNYYYNNNSAPMNFGQMPGQVPTGLIEPSAMNQAPSIPRSIEKGDGFYVFGQKSQVN